MPLTITPPAVNPAPVSVPLTLGSTVIATSVSQPPAIQPAAITISDAEMIAALEADGYTVTSGSTAPTPPPTTTTGKTLPAPANLPAGPYSVAGTPDVVFAGGALNWPVDFSYGGLTHSIVADPNGSGAMVLECYTQAGTGGWQPGYQNPPPPYTGTPELGTTYNTYSIEGKNYLNVDVLVTEQNCTFVSGFLAANDSAIPGATNVTMEKFGGPLVVGSWVRLKIPLGAGGYNLPAEQSVLKFNVQENNPMAGNKFYFNNVFFSAT